jgi:hypothetical protein
VIVPVAEVGDTVAVNVSLVPTVVEVEDAVSVTVLDVEPVGACQKSPHPVPNPTSSGIVSPRRIRVLLALLFIFVIQNPLLHSFIELDAAFQS